MFFYIVLCVSLIDSCYSLASSYPRYNHIELPDGPVYGDPLFLTPYIKNGQIEVGQAASMVRPLKENVTSYAGFLTVNEAYKSNMFFWYFPAENTPETAPVIVWLQGGPGASSLLGLFEEHGPFYVKKHRGLKMREIYWAQALHVIYIDNPVGTGFSFTENDAGYCKDEVCVGENLYEAVRQFFTLFPNLQKNDFYVTGESYGGKYVPALSHTIHAKNPGAQLKINFKGMAIGNGLCDPVHMTAYGDYLYQIGLIDDIAKARFTQAENDLVDFIKQKKWKDAFNAFDHLLNEDLTNSTSYFRNVTGFSFYFNYLHFQEDSPFGDMNEYLSKDLVRRSIHVGNLTFHTDKKVEMNLMEDVMQSVAPWVEEIANNYKVLIYNGQLDIIVAYPLTVNFLKNLNWCGSPDYKTAQRNIWRVNGQIAGYSKTVAPPKCSGSLTEVLVRDAGHMVPQDQPLWAMDLITRFTHNKPF